MASLDTRPDVVNISHYAGDTLTIVVTAPSALVGGRTWSAQVRANNNSAVIDATFAITPPAVPDGPAYLVLSAAETARLAGLSGTRRRSVRDGVVVMIASYSGVWDVQVAHASGDPVTTLAYGSLTIDADVTRAP